ncbi:hypothetical protein CLU79DRAFT_889655 [Phycomyces nitens]|nr:hypothetical protein CLU79DRAFT_889655 [Phycomyces nitens]
MNSLTTGSASIYLQPTLSSTEYDTETIVDIEPSVIHEKPSISLEKAVSPADSTGDGISKLKSWLRSQWKDDSNRHAFQLATAMAIASLFVVIGPIDAVFKNSFWPFMLSPSLTPRWVAIFPQWNWHAAIIFTSLLFLQAFFIAKIKQRPSTAFAGNVGMSTAAILSLSGYSNIIKDDIYGILRLAMWRIVDLLIAFVIVMWICLCIFPSKAKRTLRKNLSKALNEAADIYEEMAGCYLYSNKCPDSVGFPNPGTSNLGETSRHPCLLSCSECVQSANKRALDVLARLHKESARLPNVSKESYFTMPTRLLFGSGRTQWRRDLDQTKRYNEVLSGINQIFLTCVSFRLLAPLVRSEASTSKPNAAQDAACESEPAQKDSDHAHTFHSCIAPSKTVRESFLDSLKVIRKLALMLKDGEQNLSEHPDWPIVRLTILRGSIYIQQGLAVMTENSKEDVANKSLVHYGFMIRCSMIWQSLEIIVENLCHHKACSVMNSDIAGGSL